MPLAAKPSNRRSSQRKPPRRSLKLECRKGSLGLGANVATQCLDLSEGGARIVVKAALAAAEEVEVLLSGFGIPTVKRLANVCWAVAMADGQFCIGLRFQKHLAYRDVQALSAP